MFRYMTLAAVVSIALFSEAVEPTATCGGAASLVAQDSSEGALLQDVPSPGGGRALANAAAAAACAPALPDDRLDMPVRSD